MIVLRLKVKISRKFDGIVAITSVGKLNSRIISISLLQKRQRVNRWKAKGANRRLNLPS